MNSSLERKEVMVFWIIVPCSLVVANQCFRGRAASISRVEVWGQGDRSTAMLPTWRGLWCVIWCFHGGK